MQSTLLGLAIAIILALITALVGPYFVDWNSYRNAFEDKASRMIGLPVRVTGPIDARILPTPSVRLRAIEIGPPGKNAIRAEALGVDFGLGPLIRGELRAVEMQIVRPQFTVSLDEKGWLVWPRPAGDFDPDAFVIEKLNIEDGRAILADARSGARLVLKKFWFNGAVRSLAGPFKGDGAFVIGSALYGYRLSTGRSDEDGAVKLRLGIDATDKPLSVEADGTLKMAQGTTRYEGTLTVARTAGAKGATGSGLFSKPWRATAKVKAGPTAALMQQIAIQYGPPEREIKFGGTAEFKFGAQPRFAGVMSARQLDLDRSFATAGAPRHPPVAAIKSAASLFAHAFEPAFPVQFGIDVESAIIGGASLQTVRGDVKFDGKAWTVENFEFRAPGYTQTHLSGRLDAEGQDLGFAGRVEIDASDPRALIAWLEGRHDTQPGAIRPLRVRGDVAFGSKRMAVDNLHAEFDGETLEGRVAYVWPAGDRPAQLDAELRADKLDIDGVLAFAEEALRGTTLVRPREMNMAVEIKEATVANIAMKGAKAKLRRDAKGFHIERLEVADLGGTSFEASGHIDNSGSAPRGQLALDLDARQLKGVTALLGKFVPDAAAPFRRYAERLAPAKLHATLNFDRDTDKDSVSVVRLAAKGALAATRIDLRSEVRGKLSEWDAAKLSVDGNLETEDAKALVALLGLANMVAVGPASGRLDLKASGDLSGALDVEGRIAAGGLTVKADGKVKLFDTQGVTGTLQLVATGADAHPLRPPTKDQSAATLPVSLKTRIDLAGAKVAFEDLSGRIAGSQVSGRIALVTGTPTKIDGRIAVETIDAGAVIASAIGMPLVGAAKSEQAWSTAPFAAGFLADLDGRIAFTAARAEMAHLPAVAGVTGSVRLGRSELALEDVKGSLVGGELKGDLTVRQGTNGLTVRVQIELRNVDASAMLPKDAGSVLSGRATLNLMAEGAGRSPRALVGSLAGKGRITLDDAQWRGVDTAVFATVTKAVDGGLAVQTVKVRDAVRAAFDRGRLGVKHIESAITLSNGQVRLDDARTQVGDAEIAAVGDFDLTAGTIDLRTTLSGPKGSFASLAGRPDILVTLRGAVTNPQRSIDVSALVGWFTLRAVEQQARRLQAVEANRRVPKADRVERPASPVVRPSATGTLTESRPSRAAVSPITVDPREVIDRLRPEPPVLPPERSTRRRGATGRSTPSAASLSSQTVPAIHQAPTLPAPIEITPSPGAQSAPKPTRGSAANSNVGSQTAPGGQGRRRPRGPSLDELLIRPQN